MTIVVFDGKTLCADGCTTVSRDGHCTTGNQKIQLLAHLNITLGPTGLDAATKVVAGGFAGHRSRSTKFLRLLNKHFDQSIPSKKRLFSNFKEFFDAMSDFGDDFKFTGLLITRRPSTEKGDVIECYSLSSVNGFVKTSLKKGYRAIGCGNSEISSLYDNAGLTSTELVHLASSFNSNCCFPYDVLDCETLKIKRVTSVPKRSIERIKRVTLKALSDKL